MTEFIFSNNKTINIQQINKQFNSDKEAIKWSKENLKVYHDNFKLIGIIKYLKCT